MGLRELVAEVAEEHRVFPPLIWGIVQAESAGDSSAFRHEPHYRYLWDVVRHQPFRKLSGPEVDSTRPPADFQSLPRVSQATEWFAQRTSWGLMQVMGAVAREMGFYEPFLSRLCHQQIGLEIGCKFVRRLMHRYGDQRDLVVSAYNAGSPRRDPDTGLLVNQAYVDRVIYGASKFADDKGERI